MYEEQDVLGTLLDSRVDGAAAGTRGRVWPLRLELLFCEEREQRVGDRKRGTHVSLLEVTNQHVLEERASLIRVPYVLKRLRSIPR